MAEDIFRLKTCPACDYSLVGLPAEGVCPECGRRYDQSFIILTGRRGARFDDSKGGSWWNVGWTTAWVLFVVWTFSVSGELFKDPTLMVFMSGLVVMTGIELFFLLFSPRRAHWQIWISQDGIAQVLSTGVRAPLGADTVVCLAGRHSNGAGVGSRGYHLARDCCHLACQSGIGRRFFLDIANRIRAAR